MIDKKYSTIRMGVSNKAHIFNHNTKQLLCKTGKVSPYKINKKLLNSQEMHIKFIQYAIKRGYPNPYKYTCKKCEILIKADQLKLIKETFLDKHK